MSEASEALLVESMLVDKPQNYKLAYLVALKAAGGGEIKQPEYVFRNMLSMLNACDKQGE